MTIGFALFYGLSFALATALISHTLLYHGSERALAPAPFIKVADPDKKT